MLLRNVFPGHVQKQISVCFSVEPRKIQVKFVMPEPIIFWLREGEFQKGQGDFSNRSSPFQRKVEEIKPFKIMLIQYMVQSSKDAV